MTALSDQLQLWGLDGNSLLFSDGSLGFGVRLTPIDISCWTDDAIQALAGRASTLLNGLPAGVSLQFVQEITQGHGAEIEGHERAEDLAAPRLARALLRHRTARLKKLDKDGGLPCQSLSLLIRSPNESQWKGTASWLGRSRDYPRDAEETLVRTRRTLGRLKVNLLSELESLGLAPQGIPADEMLQLVYQQWNPDRASPLVHYDPEDIRSSLLFTDVVSHLRGFSIGGYEHRVLSLKLMPDTTFASMAEALRDLPFRSRLFLTLQACDQQKELSLLQNQRRLAYAMARGKRTGVSDLESEAKLQDLETLLSEMVSQGEKVFRVSVNVVLRARTEEELDAQVSQVLGQFRQLSGAEAMEESIAAFSIFREIALPNARATERVKRMKTTTLADFLPLYGSWRGHERPSVLARTRSSGLVGIDPFDPALTNSNQLISGGSGSGKSFLTNILLLQMLKEDPEIFIIDIGGSYQKMCEQLGGQYIPLGAATGLSMNPFDLSPGEKEPSPQKIKFLTALIEVMTHEEGSTTIPRLERAEIEEAIAQTYAEVPIPRLSDLRAKLLSHADTSVRRYGRILSAWCGDTLYGQWIDRPTSVQLGTGITSFDLKGLETYPDLQAVCLFVLTDLIWREFQRNRDRKKFLVFDECWRLLESAAGASFVADVFRTFRKYYASAIAISQNVDDFAKSQVAGAILSNSSIRWCLSQRGADFDRLRDVLKLNDRELALVESLRQERGRYSEAFLMAQDARAVVAIEATPLEYWIATTDPRDLAVYRKAVAEKPERDKLRVLRELAFAYPHGVTAADSASLQESI